MIITLRPVYEIEAHDMNDMIEATAHQRYIPLRSQHPNFGHSILPREQAQIASQSLLTPATRVDHDPEPGVVVTHVFELVLHITTRPGLMSDAM